MTYVIFHGSFGHSDDNWFPYLKQKLENINQKVYVPQFPVDDWDEITNNGLYVFPKNQKLSSWMKTFEDTYKSITNKKNLCFIGHSIGCLFILHVVAKYNIQLDSAIFVSPFLNKLNKNWQIDHVNNPFYKDGFDWIEMKRLIPVSYSIYSENDPYMDVNSPEKFTKLMGSSRIIVKNGGHLNSESGIYNFPLIYDLCTSRLSLEEYISYGII